MLPTEFLMFRVKAGLVQPRRLKPTTTNLQLAETLIATVEAHVGKRKYELQDELRTLEEGRADFKVLRGLAHLLMQQCTFETGGEIEPGVLRNKVFELAQGHPPSRKRAALVLEQAAEALAGDRRLTAPELVISLYADLPDQQTLVTFEPLEPKALIHRFDIAQAQGMLYRAYSLIITARRNEPSRYKQLLRYAKLFGLMLTVEGDPDFGFTLTMDGPTSLFGGTTRYGVALAKFLPALLHVTRWDLSAAIKPRKDLAWVDPEDEEWSFQLTSEDGYVSHYKVPEEHDSALESGFAERFAKLDTEWQLEREVDLVPIPGGVILPDFRLVHPDGRSILIEIVGYWRPDYLKKKFTLLKKSGRQDLIVCVSERLNLEKAGVKTESFDGRLIWFKGVLPPKEVIEAAERLTGKPA